MGLFGSLRASLSQYRKRSKLPLDGRPAGLEHSRVARRNDSIQQGYPYGTGSAGSSGLYGFSHAEAYDPHPGFADSAEPEYRTYEGHLPHHMGTTPLLKHRAATPGAEPPFPEYNDALMTDELFNDAMQAVLAENEADAPAGAGLESPGPPDGWGVETALDVPPASLLDAGTTAPVDHHMVPNMEQVESLDGLVPDLAEEPGGIESLLQPNDQLPDVLAMSDDALFGEALDPMGQAQQLFDQQMQALDQLAQPEDPFEPQQQMCDRQMQQLMDPFGMPGPMG